MSEARSYVKALHELQIAEQKDGQYLLRLDFGGSYLCSETILKYFYFVKASLSYFSSSATVTPANSPN